MNYSPEVLIYLQTFKNHLQNNQDAKNYFLANLDEEEFYRHILEVSEKNFKKNRMRCLFRRYKPYVYFNTNKTDRNLK